MKQFLEYWPILLVAAQVLLAALILWVEARTTRKVDQAVAPVKGELGDVERRVGKLEIRLEDAEGDIKNLPTKADLARVEGEVKGAHQEAAAANAGIKRIEGYFIAKGVESA